MSPAKAMTRYLRLSQSSLMIINMFIVQASGTVFTFFFFETYEWDNKQECLSSSSLSSPVLC
jgi:hypothetical protein